MLDQVDAHEKDTTDNGSKERGVSSPQLLSSAERESVEASGASHMRTPEDAQVDYETVASATQKMAQHADRDEKLVKTSPSPTKRGSAEMPSNGGSALPAHKNLQKYEVALRKDVYGLGIYFTEARDCAIVDPKLPFYRLPSEVVAPGEASGLIMPGDVLCAINGHELQGLPFVTIVEELRCIPIGDVTLTFERPFPLVTLVLQSDQGKEAGHQRQTKNQEVIQHQDQEQRQEKLGESVVNNQLENDTSEENDEKRRAKRWSVFQRLSSTAASITGASGASSIASLEIAALENLLSEMEAKLQTSEENLEREKKCRFLSEKKNILYRNELLRLSEENSLLRYKLAKEKSSRAQKEDFCRTQLHLAI